MERGSSHGQMGEVMKEITLMTRSKGTGCSVDLTGGNTKESGSMGSSMAKEFMSLPKGTGRKDNGKKAAELSGKSENLHIFIEIH